jgi:hypothetical protein
MQTVNTNLDKDKSSEGQAPFQATQVQTTMKLYERIQGYIFRLMATDSVPRVCPLLLLGRLFLSSRSRHCCECMLMDSSVRLNEYVIRK